MIKIDIQKILLPVVFVLSVTGSINGQTTEAKLPLSGVITDAATKKAIIGIRVTVENFSATITDENGNFTINVPSYDAELVISGDGYETRHIPLKGRKNMSIALLMMTIFLLSKILTCLLEKCFKEKQLRLWVPIMPMENGNVPMKQ